MYLNDVLIGLILSDGYLERSSPTSAVRLTVSFGAKHSGYLLHLYDLFEPYTKFLLMFLIKKLKLIMRF